MQNDRNDSIHGDDDFNIKFSAQKEKLDNLINVELKHSGVYRDIYYKDNLLKVYLENLYKTCQHLETQIKKKSDQLDNLYDKLCDYQKQNQTQLEKEISSIYQQCAEINTSYLEAFDVYNYHVSKDTYEILKNETDKIEKNKLVVSEKLSTFQQKEEINNIVIKKIEFAQGSDTINAYNMLFEMLRKCSNIQLEETNTKLIQEIQLLHLLF